MWKYSNKQGEQQEIELKQLFKQEIDQVSAGDAMQTPVSQGILAKYYIKDSRNTYCVIYCTMLFYQHHIIFWYYFYFT